MHKRIILMSYISLLCFASMAMAGVGRSLPTGEEEPLYLKALYIAKEGELHFVKAKSASATAYLRIASGKLYSLSRIDGPSYCDEWFISPDRTEIPNGCEFQFELDGNTITIRSETLQKGNIFQSLSTVLKAQINAS